MSSGQTTMQWTLSTGLMPFLRLQSSPLPVVEPSVPGNAFEIRSVESAIQSVHSSRPRHDTSFGIVLEKAAAPSPNFKGGCSLVPGERNLKRAWQILSMLPQDTDLRRPKGFEVVDRELLETYGTPRAAEKSLDFVFKLKPRPRLRLVHFILRIEFAFYINRSGQRGRNEFMMTWKEKQPTGFEIRHIETGLVSQVILGLNLPLLFAHTPLSVDSDGGDGQGLANGLQQDKTLMASEDRILAVHLTTSGQGESYLMARRRFPVTFHPYFLIEARHHFDAGKSRGSNTPRTVTEVLSFFEATGTTGTQGNQPHRDHDPPEKRQRNGRPVTMTVAPLQLGTVFQFTDCYALVSEFKSSGKVKSVNTMGQVLKLNRGHYFIFGIGNG
ncbi:hypothetical protein B0H13DRAFT_1890738 [Mycena leptocephala]|nr:hypothetical protein B0H13DRAFT_1890738 [Mycena leptocephala]